jgi:hypothetical protein
VLNSGRIVDRAEMLKKRSEAAAQLGQRDVQLQHVSSNGCGCGSKMVAQARDGWPVMQSLRTKVNQATATKYGDPLRRENLPLPATVLLVSMHFTLL